MNKPKKLKMIIINHKICKGSSGNKTMRVDNYLNVKSLNQIKIKLIKLVEKLIIMTITITLFTSNLIIN